MRKIPNIQSIQQYDLLREYKRQSQFRGKKQESTWGRLLLRWQWDLEALLVKRQAKNLFIIYTICLAKLQVKAMEKCKPTNQRNPSRENRLLSILPVLCANFIFCFSFSQWSVLQSHCNLLLCLADNQCLNWNGSLRLKARGCLWSLILK